MDNYIFEVNIEQTQNYYNSHSLCKCDHCQIFYRQIKGKFPKLQNFLAEFGIDISKPDEISSVESDNSIDYLCVDYTVCGKVVTMGTYEMDLYDNLFLSIVVTDGFASPNEQKDTYFTLSVYGIKINNETKNVISCNILSNKA